MIAVLDAPATPAAVSPDRFPAAAADAPGGFQPLCLREARAYRGPSLYAYRRVLRLTLDLGGLEDHPTTRLGEFSARLVERVPTLQEHTCSYDEPGGFIRRLHEGTWLGHVVEHVAIELQCLAGTPVSYGKTRSVRGEKAGVYHVVYSYNEERVGFRAGWLALRLVEELLPVELRGFQGLDELCPGRSDPFDFQAEMTALIGLASHLALGPTTQSLVDEAARRGIPAIRLNEQSLVQLGYGKYQQRVCASVSGRTSSLAVDTASDKELTSELLDEAGLPVPRNVLVRDAEEAVRAAGRLGYPVVTKPLDVSHGRGVSINLGDADAVRWGFEQAAAYRTAVLVERFLPGRDYRVLVVNDQVVAVAERVPAHVVGDGARTIAQLIEEVNRDPRRGIGHEKVLTRLTINDQAERLLQQAGFTLDTVLPAGEAFFLRSTANISTGGTAVDRTGTAHYENLEIARRAARVIGLDIAGIDLIMPDISRPLSEVGGGIVEVNAGPGFRMHLQPSEGQARNVARPVIDMLFPPGTPGRIPLVAITGTNGKTTTSRMVAHTLKLTGKRVGLTTTDGIYIDGTLYRKGDLTGPWSARLVLKDPTIEAAVLETARGGILREGLGFDRCDVGAVLNVSADHLGMKGIETLEDLAEVKSLVAEVVRDDGYSVLNADDPLVTAMAGKAGGKIIYFSMRGGEGTSHQGNGEGSGHPAHLCEHLARGGVAVVLQPSLRGDMITIYDGERYLPVMWTHQIPATISGQMRSNVENALATTAIAYALGISLETIRQALGTFVTTYHQNPGRLNVYDGLPFRVLMDYGHNPAALEHMRDLVTKLRPNHRRVLGTLSGTGDRRDEDIIQLGEIMGRTVDELIIKEDERRGRAPGECAELIRRGALSSGLGEDRITCWLPESQAVDLALSRARPGDLLVLFASNIPDVWQRVTSFQPATDGAATAAA